MAAATVLILLLGVVLFVGARRQEDPAKAKRTRSIALVFMIVALAIAVLDALDMISDHG